MFRPSSKTPRLTLADLVDLEMQFQADRERDSLDLRRRDAAIGQALNAPQLAAEGRDREMFLGWLRQIRAAADPHESSPGRQIQLFLDVVGLVLALLGLSVGFGAVTGWLRMDPTEPVNAIFFWAVIIGVQVLLLGVWLLAVVPSRWLHRLPGAEAVQVLLRLIARALPLLVAWAAAKMSPEHRVLLARLRGTLQSWSWIYGGIRFWKLVGMTQVFAVAYNVGAILAFVAISYGNDPAFGWKSRLLAPEELHAVVQTLALPWSWTWPDAAPTLEHIALTRYSSLDPRYLETFQRRGGASDAWVLWWPFLLACLLFYGLLPRIVTLTVSKWNARRALNRVRLDHGDFYKLKDRLTRPLVETQATTPEVGGPPQPAPHKPPPSARREEETPRPKPQPETAQKTAPAAPAREIAAKEAAPPTRPAPPATEPGPPPPASAAPPASAPSQPAAPSAPAPIAPVPAASAPAAPRQESPIPETPVVPAAPVVSQAPERAAPARPRPQRSVVKWAGVNVGRDEVAQLVRARLNVEPEEIYTVGDLEGKEDERTLRALENDGQGEVLMVVESWEPPIADYVDFLSDLRDVVGRERMIVILLYNRDPEGRPTPPRPRDVKVWRDQIASLGDPWMCVEELVESQAEVGG